MHWRKCVFHLFILIGLSRLSWAGLEEPAENCCLRIPPPMNIAKFDAKVIIYMLSGEGGGGGFVHFY